MNGTDLDPVRIEAARSVIDPAFLDTPQFVDPMLAAELGRRVLLKVETLNPLRSFKGRGAENLLHVLAPSGPLVCASMGNFGQALAYAGGRRGLPVTVFVPESLAEVKVRRMAALGATVQPVAGDGAAAVAAAREFAARDPERTYLEDGREPAMAEGAGTIGVELLRDAVDTVVLPVGDAALITGVACWVKRHAPAVRIVGVCATGAPCMAHSWRAGQAVPTARADTIAEGIAVRDPAPEAVSRMRALVDDMLLVDDAAINEAVDLAACTAGVLLEPAGAAGLAAIREHEIPGELVATVLTGANPASC